MRLLPIVILLGVLAIAPAADAKRSCGLKGSKTVVENRYARVYTLPGKGADEVKRLYGCHRGLGRRVLLDVHTDDNYVASEEYFEVGLNGRMVVWEHVSTDVSCKGDCPSTYDSVVERVLVADLRSRRERAYTGNPLVDTLFVTRAGTPAWLQRAGDAFEVHAARSVLDTGAIDSLSLHGRVLSWLNAGVAKTATLH
jgi:hypothetical protein